MSETRPLPASHCRIAVHRLRVWRPILPTLLIFILLLQPVVSAASSPPVLIIKSGSEAVYQQVVTSLSKSLITNCKRLSPDCTPPQLVEKLLGDSTLETLFPLDTTHWKLVITIGLKAARYMDSRRHEIPILHTLIPRSTAPGMDLAPDQKQRHSAIYIDQPINRTMRLITFIEPVPKRLGLLLGPSIVDMRAGITVAARQTGFVLDSEYVSKPKQVGGAIRRILKKSDILLALPDPLVYNRQTIVSILLSSYHSRIPVIGFSAAYVKAGAIAAVYSTPDDIGRHISELVWRFLSSRPSTLPPPEYPRYFHVETNPQVSHSLGIDLPSAHVIKQRLESLEGQ